MTSLRGRPRNLRAWRGMLVALAVGVPLLALQVGVPEAGAQSPTPDAPSRTAVYSISSQRLEVRWSAFDAPAAVSFKVQWKSGSQDYDTSRQDVVDEIAARVPGASHRYKHEITGLMNGAQYTVRVIATNAAGDSPPSDQATGTPQSSPGQALEFIENEVLYPHESSFPWLRDVMDYIERRSIPVRFNSSSDGFVNIDCTSESSGLNRCYAHDIPLGRGAPDLLRLIVHELAHVLTLSNDLLHDPGPVAITHLYFANLLPLGPGCLPSELYADILMILVHPEAGSERVRYWKRCTGPRDEPTGEALAAVRSALAGIAGAWFPATYDNEESAPDLERVWADVKGLRSNTYRTSLVYQLRGEFGGYCDDDRARESVFGGGATRNPWRDGGCVPAEPGGLMATAVGNGALTLSWHPSPSDGGSPVQGYRVQWKSGLEDYDPSREHVVTQLMDPRHTLTGLTVGAEHSVRVLAYNHNGDGAPAETTATPAATDTTAPLFRAARVEGDRLVLTYNEGLDGSSSPPPTAFEVLADSVPRSVSTVSVSRHLVTLRLTSDVQAGATVRLTYTAPTGPDSSAIRDVAENNAASLSQREVRNLRPGVSISSDPGADTTYALNEGDGAEDEIEVTVAFSETVKVAGPLELRLRVGHSTKRAEYAEGSGTSQLRFRYAVAEGDADTDGVSVLPGDITGGGTIRYASDGVRAPAQIKLADQPGHRVDAVRPRLVAVRGPIDGTRLTLAWSEPLDMSAVPPVASQAFEVAVGGIPRSIADVSVDASTVTLTLASAITSMGPVTVSYDATKAAYNGLRDAAGNHAESAAGGTSSVRPRLPVFVGPGGGGPPPGPTPSEADFEWTVTHDLDALDPGHGAPTGMWSDGATLWLADNAEGAGDAVYAYDLERGERAEEREFALDQQNRAPRGVWSDGVTVWVSDSGRDRLFAYALEGGERLPDRDLELASRNADARGIWSDARAMWVLDDRRDALFAYHLASGSLLAEYELGTDNDQPHGVWSDGTTLWVSNHDPKRLYAYRLPAAPEAPAAGDAEPAALERSADLDFTGVSKAGNNSPRGLWSDGAVMYVADANDGKVYSYNMPDAIDARLASLIFDGVAIGAFSPLRHDYEGVAADGVTQTTVTADAVQPGAAVAIDPPDADEEAEGHQVALAGVEEIAVTVTSEDESRTRTYRVLLENAGPEPWPHCLRGDVAVGFSLVVYEGGSLDDLVACAESRAITALYVLDGGEWVSYIAGAPDVVNAGFGALFAGGVPALTPLVARSDGPPSDDPVGTLGEQPPWRECLLGEVAEGFSLVVYEGGSVRELADCAGSRGISAVYALVEGEWVSYILGAPDLVNAAFGEQFIDGLPTMTPLVAASE